MSAAEVAASAFILAGSALALLAALGAQRHGQDGVVRALARTERAAGPVSAFG